MTVEEVHALILSFPDAVEASSYGKPAYKVAGKFFTRLRDEDDSLVLIGVGFDEREMLMEAEPDTFHITDHYRNASTVLARIATVHPGSLEQLLRRRWRAIAPKALVRVLDHEALSPRPSRREGLG
jgi:hypothetical protein